MACFYSGVDTFGKEWWDDCWRLGYYPLDEQDPYIDKSKIDPADYAEDPHQWNGVIFADQEMIRQFEEVRECLEMNLWTGEVKTQFVDSHGKLVDLDRSIWRERYSRYTISWAHSELLGKEDGSREFVKSWIVRHFPDNPQFVANSSHTPPPMEEISLCGHPTALI